MQQAELADFLMRSQQVALDAIGDEGQGLRWRGLPLPLEPLADPGRQVGAAQRRNVDPHTGRVECSGPAAVARGSIERRQADQRQQVVGRIGGVLAQCLAAFAPRLARGQADFDDALLGKQRQALRGAGQQRPVAAPVGVDHLAFAEAGGPRRSPDRILRLHRQQRLVARHHVDRCKRPARQTRGELLGAYLHGGLQVAPTGRAAASRRSTCCTRSLCMSR